MSTPTPLGRHNPEWSDGYRLKIDQLNFMGPYRNIIPYALIGGAVGYLVPAVRGQKSSTLRASMTSTALLAASVEAANVVLYEQ